MREFTENASQDTAAICIDFMQNLQLPNIPVQEVFYLRQLVVNVFCIHDLKSGKAVFYMYHEGIAYKGPNEVCSFINDYIDTYIQKDKKYLHIFSDSCSAQNKNHCIVRMFLALIENKRFASIVHYYPIRGHSFMACDRNFGLIKRHIKKTDRVYTPKQYAELIVESSQQQQFTVHMVNTQDILDFKKWWPQYYKKTTLSLESSTSRIPKDQKVSFQISHFHEFVYSNNRIGSVKTRRYIDGIEHHTFRLKSLSNIPCLPSNRAYPDGFKKINIKKNNDIKKVEK